MGKTDSKGKCITSACVLGIGSLFFIDIIKNQIEMKNAMKIADENGIKIRIPSSNYEKYIKRPLDKLLSIGSLIIFSPIMGAVAIAVKKKLGSPVIFIQKRPGLIDPATGEESIFELYKFRTMTDECDENGNLLPDSNRLTNFGSWLRATSLDELPELINVIKGDMSIIGPRPQLVRDMVFMTNEQRKRHEVRPGLSGLAQIRGRNELGWEDKLNSDLEYIKKITFVKDVKIVIETARKVIVREGINEPGEATALDFGDELLKEGKIDKATYLSKNNEANDILNPKLSHDSPSPTMPYSVLMSLYAKEKPEYLDRAIRSMVEQTYSPDEIVIVLDGKITCELQKVIDKYKRNYPNLFRIVGYKSNKGLGHALKFGLKYCKNELIARMDTDDISESDRCEKQVSTFENRPDIDVLGGQIEEFSADISNIVGRREVPLTDSNIKKYMQRRCPFNHVTVMFKKSAVLKAGNYRQWPFNEDYYLWIRMADSGCVFANLPDVMVKVRVGQEMYSRRGGIDYFKSEAAIQNMMRNHKMISAPRYMVNISERLVLQVLMPTEIRGWFFRSFARKK